MRLFARVWIVMLLGLLLSLSLTSGAQEEQGIAAPDSIDRLLIAFVSNRDGNDEIYIMDSSGLNQRNITRSAAGEAEPSWSPDGRQVIYISDRDGNREIYATDYNTLTSTRLIDLPDSEERSPVWSPDGSMIAFLSNMAGGNAWDIYTYDVATREITRITTNDSNKRTLSWSADGTFITFAEREFGQRQIRRIEVNSRLQRLLTSIGPENETPVWTPDGRCIVFASNRINNNWQLWSMRENGDLPREITGREANSAHPSLSPDGSTLVFVTDRDESDEIYAVDAALECNGTFDGDPAPNLRRLTSNTVADHSPAWQPRQPVIELAAVDPVIEDDETVEARDVTTTSLDQSVAEVSAEVALNMNEVITRYGIGAWHDVGWLGEGQRIAVFDNGFGGLAALIQNVLGAPVNIPPGDSPGDYDSGRNDHGTRVLEIVHTIAPKAELYACRYDTLVKFESCVDWALQNRVRIVNHSAGLPLLPLNGTNAFSQIASKAVQNGILWFNSAGNFAQGFLSERGADANQDNYHDFGQANNLLRFENQGRYSGNIVLSWQQEADDPLIPPELGFELEVVDLNTDESIAFTQGTTIETARDQQFRRVWLSTTSGFGVRVRPNTNLTPEQFNKFRLVLFVERGTIDGGDLNGSVIAPGDLNSAITVGAVVGTNNELAPFSSRGLLNSERLKPDLVAPGAILLDTRRFSRPDEALFFGTSAASPVAAAMAALAWEAYDEFTWDDIYRYMLNDAIRPGTTMNLTLGNGIVTLPGDNIPARGVGVEIAGVEPYVVFVDLTSTVAAIREGCPGAILTRLEVGVQAYILTNMYIYGGLRLRAEPSTNGARIAQLDEGTEFEVIGGPDCREGMNWWNVRLDDGTSGYLAEGVVDVVLHNEGGYLLAPVSLDRAEYVGMESTDVCNAPTTQLMVGATARTVEGSVVFFNEIEGRNEIAELGRDTDLVVLGGPRCEGSSDQLLRWYVRVMNGRLAGAEGWTTEAVPGNRYIELVSAPDDSATVSTQTEPLAPTPTPVTMAMTQGAPLPSPTPTITPTISPSAFTCVITANDRVNLRGGPGTNFTIVRAMEAGASLRGVGQNTDSTGSTWWRLTNRAWVRFDLVSEDGNCDGLPVSGPDDPLPVLNPSFPTNRAFAPADARLLSGGRGLTDGRRMENGEFQLEWYCGDFGYAVNHNANAWFCTRPDNNQTVFTLGAADFDTICQATYSNEFAFAVQDGSSDVPAYRWRCYAR